MALWGAPITCVSSAPPRATPGHSTSLPTPLQPAGLSRVGPVVEQPLSQLEEVMDTNLVGVVRLTQASYSCTVVSQPAGWRQRHAAERACTAHALRCTLSPWAAQCNWQAENRQPLGGARSSFEGLIIAPTHTGPCPSAPTCRRSRHT